MERKNLLIMAGLIAGLMTGVVASASIDSENKCEKTEQTIRQEANITGALACFQPGTIDVNLSDKVEENADLECVCRRSSDQGVQIWAINRAK